MNIEFLVFATGRSLVQRGLTDCGVASGVI